MEGSSSPYSQTPSSGRGQFVSPRPEAAEGGLRVSGLCKSIRGRAVVHDLSLQVRAGERVGILGANGAGKSTCLQMIAGFLPCDRGSIHLHAQELTRLSADQRARRGLAFLPQDSSIFRRMSVADNLRAMLELRGHSPDEVEHRTRVLLQQFQLEPLREQPGAGLSGGERRRTEIARALTGEPEFLLLDEPFAGLDPISIHGIRKILCELSEQGTGILVNDHNAREILGLCDRTYVVERGRVLAEGDSATLQTNPIVHASYLGEQFRA